jgi:CRP-like cAMP-binding protein
MEPEAKSGRMDALQARPLAELLECPPATGNVLNGSAQCIDFDAGEIVFRQSEICKGLYLVISGQFLRKTERMATRLTLGSSRPGDLVELAAALGDGLHTYTLTALTPGSVLLLPLAALNAAFQDYPPLRMRLLEELAREVSRAYDACCLSRTARMRRGAAEASLA